MTDRKVTCPLLVLWGERGTVGRLYDVMKIADRRMSLVQDVHSFRTSFAPTAISSSFTRWPMPG